MRLAIAALGSSVLERMALTDWVFPGLAPLTNEQRRMVLDIMWRRDWYHHGQHEGWWES